MNKQVYLSIITQLDPRILNLIKNYVATSLAIPDMVASYHYSNHAEIHLCTANNIGVHSHSVVGEYSESEEVISDPDAAIEQMVSRMKEHFDVAYRDSLTSLENIPNEFYRAMNDVAVCNRQLSPDSNWIEYKFIEPLCNNTMQVIQFFTKDSVNCPNPHAIQLTIIYSEMDVEDPLQIYVNAAVEVSSTNYRSFNPLNLHIMQEISGRTYTPRGRYQFSFDGIFKLHFDCPALREARKSLVDFNVPIYLDARTGEKLPEQYGHILHPVAYIQQVEVLRLSNSSDNGRIKEVYAPSPTEPKKVFLLEGSTLETIWALMIEMSIKAISQEKSRLGY